MKKIAAIVSCLALILASIPVYAFAEDEADNYQYAPVFSKTAGLENCSKAEIKAARVSRVLEVYDGMSEDICIYMGKVNIKTREIESVSVCEDPLSIRYKTGEGERGPLWGEEQSVDLKAEKIGGTSNQYHVTYSIGANPAADETAAGFEYDLRFITSYMSYNAAVQLDGKIKSGQYIMFSDMPGLENASDLGPVLDRLTDQLTVNHGQKFNVYIYMVKYSAGRPSSASLPDGDVTAKYIQKYINGRAQFDVSSNLKITKVEGTDNRYEIAYSCDNPERKQYSIAVSSGTAQEGICDVLTTSDEPVKSGTKYSLTLEMLIDPVAFSGYSGKTDRMKPFGQGKTLQFNSYLTEWETCFFVRNESTGYDGRWKPVAGRQEVRTYIGDDSSFTVQAAKEGSSRWQSVGSSDAPEVFTIECEGYIKGYAPVYKVKYDAALDQSTGATNAYSYRLIYTGDDPYLDAGGSRTISLERVDDSQTGWELSFREYEDGEYNFSNSRHFDLAGEVHYMKFVLNPSMLQSVVDKKIYGDSSYIFIRGEQEASNLKVCTLDGKEIPAGESPLDISWDAGTSSYRVEYAYPDRDIYGPEYIIKYTGDYNSLINSYTGNPEGTDNNLSNFCGIWTSKVTFYIEEEDIIENEVTQTDEIDATTDDDVNATEVVIDENILENENCKIETNQGTVTFEGEACENMQEQDVSFEIRDVLEDDFGLTDEQKESLDGSAAAVDMSLEDAVTGEGISFGSGTAEISLACDDPQAAVVYVDDSGNETPVESSYSGGDISFEAEHFSLYIVKLSKNGKTARGVKATTVNARASRSGKYIKVSWTKKGAYKLAGYKVYRAVKKNGPYKVVKTTAASSYTDRNVKKGKTYYYKVRGFRKVYGKTVYTKTSPVKYVKR